jgi:hypothetical protein
VKPQSPGFGRDRALKPGNNLVAASQRMQRRTQCQKRVLIGGTQRKRRVEMRYRIFQAARRVTGDRKTRTRGGGIGMVRNRLLEQRDCVLVFFQLDERCGKAQRRIKRCTVLVQDRSVAIGGFREAPVAMQRNRELKIARRGRRRERRNRQDRRLGSRAEIGLEVLV